MSAADIKELHWLFDILQHIDVGLVVIDRKYRIKIWNSFMENHSGMVPEKVIGKSLLELFPEIQIDWFKAKVESAALLNNRTFTIWEQRPYLIRFNTYQPITGIEDHMFQNITIIPLVSATGEVEDIAIIIYDVTDVASNKRQLQAANLNLQALSRTDRLTQLNNRGYWEEMLNKEFARFKRYGGVSSLIMFDIDHFKKVNDTYGHQAGDKVIQTVAQTLRNNLRNTDIGGRYGGEEFGVILPDTNVDGAKIFAERLRTTVESLPVQHEDKEIRFTISLGIAELAADCPNAKHWIEQSDKALYESKHAGRNRSTVYIGND